MSTRTALNVCPNGCNGGRFVPLHHVCLPRHVEERIDQIAELLTPGSDLARPHNGGLPIADVEQDVALRMIGTLQAPYLPLDPNLTALKAEAELERRVRNAEKLLTETADPDNLRSAVYTRLRSSTERMVRGNGSGDDLSGTARKLKTAENLFGSRFAAARTDGTTLTAAQVSELALEAEAEIYTRTAAANEASNHAALLGRELTEDEIEAIRTRRIDSWKTSRTATEHTDLRTGWVTKALGDSTKVTNSGSVAWVDTDEDGSGSIGGVHHDSYSFDRDDLLSPAELESLTDTLNRTVEVLGELHTLTGKRAKQRDDAVHGRVVAYARDLAWNGFAAARGKPTQIVQAATITERVATSVRATLKGSAETLDGKVLAGHYRNYLDGSIDSDTEAALYRPFGATPTRETKRDVASFMLNLPAPQIAQLWDSQMQTGRKERGAERGVRVQAYEAARSLDAGWNSHAKRFGSTATVNSGSLPKAAAAAAIIAVGDVDSSIQAWREDRISDERQAALFAPFGAPGFEEQAGIVDALSAVQNNSAALMWRRALDQAAQAA